MGFQLHWQSQAVSGLAASAARKPCLLKALPLLAAAANTRSASQQCRACLQDPEFQHVSGSLSPTAPMDAVFTHKTALSHSVIPVAEQPQPQPTSLAPQGSNGQASSAQPDHEDVSQVLQPSYNWSKQWYPVQGVQDLDTGRPHPITLLNKELVLWFDRNAPEGPAWRCFEDSCPHRRVPLSEGRIHGDGTLQCCYHGWRFNGEGQAVAIPAVAENPAQEQRVCQNASSSVAAHPVEVRQGLLFVWGEAGALAALESQSRPVPVADIPGSIPEDELISAYQNYVRDLPGSFDVWMENMVDQSHVAFAHHGATGDREGPFSGFYHQPSVSLGKVEDGFVYPFDWSSNSKQKMQNTLFRFIPPCLSSFQLPSREGGLWIYAVPTSPNTTRLIINAGRRIKRPGLVKILQRLVPRWLLHLQLSAITDGDIVFLHRQHEANRQARLAGDGSFNWKRHYFMPGENDRGVVAWRDWLEKLAGGGPFGTRNPQPGQWTNAIGTPDRAQLLDREGQHTHACSSCSKVLRRVQFGQQALLGVAALCFLASSSLLGQGHDALPALLGVAAALLAQQALAKLERRFVFTDWVNQDKA